MRRLNPALPAVLLLSLGACMATRTIAPGQRFPVFFTNAVVVPDAGGVGVVDAAAKWARRYPTEAITVTGYADPRSAPPVAALIATRRADEVAALLEEHGVDPARIRRAIGDATVLGVTATGNRRVDIAVGL